VIPRSNPSQADSPRLDWCLGALLFVGSLAAYLRTLRPSFNWLDASELTTAAYHLGIGHNPGYPTYMLIGHLFSRLPFGSVAYRMNFMSAFFGALAVALLYCLLRRLRVTRLPAFVAAGTFAFTATLWDLTGEAEVYTLHAALTLAAILLAVSWRAGGRDRYLYAAALLVGVSLGNHALTAMLVPALLVFAALSRGLRVFTLRRCAACLGMGLLGLSVYLYVPIRAPANPPPEVNVPHSLRGFYELVTSPGCRQLMFSLPAAQVAGRAWAFARHLAVEFGPIALLLGLLGIGVLTRRDRPFLGLLATLFALTTFYAVNYQIFDIYAYFLPCYLAWAVFLGFGAETALAWGARLIGRLVGRRQEFLTAPRQAALVAAILLTLPLWTFTTHFASVDGSRDTEAADFASNVMEVVEPGAVVIGDWWSIAPLGYLKYVEGERPDVTLSVALSSFTIKGLMEVTDLDYLSRFPAAYVVEHQTARRHVFKRKYRTMPVGRLTRVFVRRPAAPSTPRRASETAAVFEDGLGLVRTGVGRGVAHPGGVLFITHRWTRLSPALWGRYEVVTALEDQDGMRIWREKTDLAHGLALPEEWEPGRAYDEEHVVFVPGDAEPGAYRVVVRVRAKDTARVLRSGGEKEVAVACVEIRPRPGEAPVCVARR